MYYLFLKEYSRL